MIRRALGKLKRYCTNTIDNGAIVLLYHRVISLDNDPQLLSVTPERFYDQIAVLKKHFHLLTIDEFYHILCNKRRFPKKAVILTFDDGYADNFRNALPVLESLKAQALFYVSTAKLGSPYEMWWDDLERIVLNNSCAPEFLELLIGNSMVKLNLNSASERDETYHKLHAMLKYIPVADRDEAIKRLQNWAGVKAEGRKEYFMMNSDELYRMSTSSSAVIGAHTHNHPALSILNYEMQLEEMSTSKKVLEKIIQKEIIHFSYPFGAKNDFNGVSILAAKATGFKMVAANYYGQVHRWTNRFAIPRILVRNWDKNTFIHHAKTFVRY